MNWLNVISILGLIGLLSWTFYYVWKNEKKQVNNNDSRNHHDDIKTVSYKLIVPLRIQAYERLLLYIERIQFPVLVKRVFIPTMTKNDFQFSLLQNVQDEFEHNLAQRLYVSEETWHLISLAKEEVMQNINAVFNDNPDAELSLIAQKLASFDNPMVEKAVRSIKCEFNSL
ncbi:MAG: hypothetical protein E7067_05890 [Lentimicrobiaceae bacterium]|nr:hypothetical protein [Lentimicrobiaceae bacterium]